MFRIVVRQMLNQRRLFITVVGAPPDLGRSVCQGDVRVVPTTMRLGEVITGLGACIRATADPTFHVLATQNTKVA